VRRRASRFPFRRSQHRYSFSRSSITCNRDDIAFISSGRQARIAGGFQTLISNFYAHCSAGTESERWKMGFIPASQRASWTDSGATCSPVRAWFGIYSLGTLIAHTCAVAFGELDAMAHYSFNLMICGLSVNFSGATYAHHARHWTRSATLPWIAANQLTGDAAGAYPAG
jgi:hypothetical protein